jgi:hypothetical protein
MWFYSGLYNGSTLRVILERFFRRIVKFFAWDLTAERDGRPARDSMQILGREGTRSKSQQVKMSRLSVPRRLIPAVRFGGATIWWCDRCFLTTYLIQVATPTHISWHPLLLPLSMSIP